MIIVGAGGQGREVAEIIAQQAQVSNGPEVLGFIDEDPRLHGCELDGLPVLGDWSHLRAIDRSEVGVICAVGRPEICRQLVERARALQLCFVSAISPRAHISRLSQLGEGVTVFPNAVINTGSRIGNHTIVNIAASVSHDCNVGAYCNINPGVHLAGNVTVEDGCYIGMGTNVIQGRRIASGSIVGAGAVVIRDIPARVTAVGVPATIIKKRNQESI